MTTTTVARRCSAPEALADHVATMRDQIARLSAAVDQLAAQQPDADWGHVGSAGYVSDRLADVVEFLGA